MSIGSIAALHQESKLLTADDLDESFKGSCFWLYVYNFAFQG